MSKPKVHLRTHKVEGWKDAEVWQVACDRPWVSESTHDRAKVTCKDCNLVGELGVGSAAAIAHLVDIAVKDGGS